MEKLEGWLFCRGWVGDAWYLLEEKPFTFEDLRMEVETNENCRLDRLLEKFEGKKVRIWVEELEDETD